MATSSALLSTRGKEGRRCPFCNEEQSAEHSDEVRDFSERKKLLFKSARCFSFLIPGQRSSQCRLKTQCRLCKGKGYHAAICTSFMPANEMRSEPSIPYLTQAQALGLGTLVLIQL